MHSKQDIKIGLAGCGALGSIIARALIAGIPGYKLIGISEIRPIDFNIPIMSFAELAEQADMVIEALPPDVVLDLARAVLPSGKPLMMLSAAALLRYPDIMTSAKPGQIQITAGALGGIDAVKAYALRPGGATEKVGGIKSAKLISTKPPHALTGAPYVVAQKLDLMNLQKAECIFTGNAYEAAQNFPANTNVAATLAFACTSPGQKLFDITVEVWADPAALGNGHKIVVETVDGGLLTSDIFSLPSPDNPKSSPQAAYALLADLVRGGGAFRV